MDERMTESVRGRVASVIYANGENGYTVLRLDLDDGSQCTVVGCIPLAAPGERLTAWGAWVRHPSHGEQFEARQTERALPADAESIFHYLAGGAVKGVGPATAAVLVASFGDETLRVLRDEPEKLAPLRGIGPKKARQLSEDFRRRTGMRTLMEFLGTAGISPLMALRLYRRYGDEALDAVRENPYVMADAALGGSFAEADALALAQGMEPDAPERVAAAVLFELRHNAENGHCFLPADKLADATARMLGVPPELAREGLDTLIDAGDIISEPVSNVQACYPAQLHEAEVYVAERLRQMAARTYPPLRAAPDAVAARLEAERGITLAAQQRRALEAAAERQLLVITGGPGTGKTTIVRAVLALFDAMGLDTLLAAPTGRAAKRLSAVTGREASTIHRLLEAGFSPETGSVRFRKRESDPLRCGALILDECSMIDISLMRAALAALGPDCRLVLVGDADQLPSVGPGCVLRDLLRSGAVEAVRLTELFRQAEGSRIALAAHEINRGQVPDLRQNTGGFYFMRRRDGDEAARTIVSLCAERLPRNMGIPPEEIQVLSPTRKGPAGTENLNLLLQAALNPPAPDKSELTLFGRVLRVGDRVMHSRNDYDILWTTGGGETGFGIFNGDVGRIAGIDASAETLTVDFDGRMAVYGFDQARQLDHAWAVTVHKAQGSEYRAVVLAMSQTPSQLIYRGLLYTAVTRAAELLVLVGDERVAAAMTENARRAKRYTGLWLRLAFSREKK